MSRTVLRPLLLIALLAPAACKDDAAGKSDAKDDKDGNSDKSEGPLALTSPTLCEHVAKLGHADLADEQRCIMRLDGLQIQLGDADWKTHGKCIQGADSTDAVDACLTAADEASLAKAKDRLP